MRPANDVYKHNSASSRCSAGVEHAWEPKHDAHAGSAQRYRCEKCGAWGRRVWSAGKKGRFELYGDPLLLDAKCPPPPTVQSRARVGPPIERSFFGAAFSAGFERARGFVLV